MGRRVVGVVDSDSFVKWGASLLDSLPADWDLSLVVVRTALTASSRQVEDAIAHTRFAGAEPRLLTARDVLAAADVVEADAVLVACRGPVAEVLIHGLAGRRGSRPVLISGLPGISIPAKWKGIFYRSQADLFVLHSHREVAAYRALALENGADVEFVLATLPFARVSPSVPGENRTRDSIVFAAQAIVPREREDRQWLVDRLCEVALAHPELRVVLKVRALDGEEQTHSEPYPLPGLLPVSPPANLVVAAGPMNEHLERAVGFATVSSTAVLEAAALGVPGLLIDDFGTDALLINEVFVGSGLLASSDELIRLRFRSIDPEWLAANYAHPVAENTFLDRLEETMRDRDSGRLRRRRPVRKSRGGALRRAWDRRLALGRYDGSVLGTIALVVGWPMHVARRTRRNLRARQAERV